MNFKLFILISIFISILFTILTIINENKKDKIFYKKRKDLKNSLETKIEFVNPLEKNQISTEEKRKLAYQEYLKSDHWQKIKFKALERAEYKCQLCSSRANLNVHHNTYKNRGHENLTDLVVLCRECHAKFHNKLP